MNNKNDRRHRYFRKQRIYGLGLILMGIISAILLEGDITVALLIIPAGLAVLFSKDMCIYDDYYEETHNEYIDRGPK